MRRAITHSCRPTCFAAHTWGQVVCAEACRAGPTPAGAVAHLQEEAARMVALVLQVRARVQFVSWRTTNSLSWPRVVGVVDHAPTLLAVLNGAVGCVRSTSTLEWAGSG